MTFREIRFIGLAAVLLFVPVTGILLFPVNIQENLEFRSEKSKRLNAPFGYPDKFIEYFAAAEGLDEGYAPYPQGYKMEEFRRAKLASAKRGSTTELAWVERGPGRVGGRTRAILVDHTDPTANTWFVGTVGGGVWKARRYMDVSDQLQVEWTPLTDHLPSLAVSTMAGASVNHPNVIYVGTGEGFGNIDASSGAGMFKTTDGGNTWTHLTSTSNNTDWAFINRIVVDPNNPDIVVAVAHSNAVVTSTSPRRSNIFRSEDGGRSFSTVHTNEGGRIQDLQAKPDDFNVQFAAINGTGILRSTDGGKTWNDSFSGLVYGGRRIELAISRSHPEVIWASVQGSGARVIFPDTPLEAPIADLYRSEDTGESWSFVENLESMPDPFKAFLGNQGWYDNAITVHPFSPDTVYIGGIVRWKSWIEGDETLNIGTVGRFANNASSFLNLVNFGGTHAGGRVDVGPNDPDVTDIENNEMTSIEIRFGPNLTQFAHRFSVPANGGTLGDGGAGIALEDYMYRNYVEVPFQVWDTDNNRQLMVSFRDQANDGKWDLIPLNTTGPGNTQSREYIFISKHDYNASTPLSDYMVDGGFTSGLMYQIWPTLVEGDEVVWDPNSPSQGTVEIDFISVTSQYRNIALWENGVVHVDHHNFTIVPIDEGSNEFHILNGNDGGFAYSRDGGETWIEGDAYAGFNTSQFYDATKRPGYPMYLGGTQDNGTWASYNMANSRRGWRFMLDGDGFDVVWKGADSLMGTSQGNNIQRSLNGGTYWESAGNIRDWPGQFLSSIGWTPESGATVFSISPAAAGGLLRSLDFGGSWHATPASNENIWGGIQGGRVFSGKVRVSLADPSVVWAGYRMRSSNGAALHVTENALDPLRGEGGQNPIVLRPVNSPSFAPTGLITGLATHPFSRATAYVTFSVSCQPKLLRTEDMGQTWEDLSGFVGTDGCRSSNGFPNARVWDVEVFPEVPRIIWAGTDLGLFESRDHGQTWAYADNGLPAVSVWRIRIVDGEVVLATHGRGVWSLDLTQVLTAAEEEAGTTLPTSFELLDNYPNPFNPSTTIGFKLAADSHIRVSVFDVLGRKVATLTDQPYSIGTHQITWDASAMGSGQYIYRMEADGKLIGTKAMVLVK